MDARMPPPESPPPGKCECQHSNYANIFRTPIICPDSWTGRQVRGWAENGGLGAGGNGWKTVGNLGERRGGNCDNNGTTTGKGEPSQTQQCQAQCTWKNYYNIEQNIT